MTVQTWTFLIVGLSFGLYIAIAIWSKARSTGEFYVAGKHVHPIANGMATGADWMSAASFISMAGIISFGGFDGARYLMGWTGGYVLLALLLAPYLRKFGKFTVPDFVGDRYYSDVARVVAVVCAIFISFTYVAGQMRGVGIVFSRFLEIPIDWGVFVGMAIVFLYAVLGGMKGITYTQVAQYCVLIFAFMVPAIFISIMMAGTFVPQLGFGGQAVDSSTYLLDKLDGLHRELGFDAYTAPKKSTIDLFCITAALMVGTAGLPHVIIRFYTVPRVRDARASAAWALVFIAILYTSAPAVAVFARVNLIESVNGAHYAQPEAGERNARVVPGWFKNWENTELIAWIDKNGDGQITYAAGDAFNGNGGNPLFLYNEHGEPVRGEWGQRRLDVGPGAEKIQPTENANELYIDRDIMVLANPEIARLPNWVVGLVAAGGLAAALSTAAGLLLVVSTSISHDLLKKTFKPEITEKGELRAARISAAIAVCIAGYLGINPPDYVAAVVAFAFGLAAASFFPAILMGIFSRRMNREGAIAGMVVGLLFTASYIVYFKMVRPDLNVPENWLFNSISPEGIGVVGMLLNFAVAIIIAWFTPAPPPEIRELIEDIRTPDDPA